MTSPQWYSTRSEGGLMADVAVAAYGVGDIDDLKATMQEWVTFRGRFEPDPRNQKIYSEIFARRQALLGGSLKDTFKGLEDRRGILGQ